MCDHPLLYRWRRVEMLPDVSRRQLVGGSLAWGGLAALAPLRSVLAAAERRITPGQALGPFYPALRPGEQDADLTHLPGHETSARGQLLYVVGRVVNPASEPIAGAAIDIWQANAEGRYDHPLDRNAAPLDPDFQGSARFVTDAEGRYSFKTIKPGAYPVDDRWVRPPHIHFEVTTRSERLVTQMYFPDEPLNEGDRLRQRAGPDRDALTAAVGPAAPDLEARALLARWDVVIAQG